MPKNKHLTILEIGDSLGTDLGGGLGLQLSKSPNVTLIQKSKSETGLANGWFYNWPIHLRQFVAQYHPQLLIVFLGGNDEQGMVVNGHAAAFNTLAWREQYQKNIAQVMNEATSKHCAVLWVGMPIMNPNGYRQGIQVINSLFQKVALTKANVTFLPTWDLMANAKGQFQFSARVNGVVQVLRSARRHPPDVDRPERHCDLRRPADSSDLSLPRVAGLPRPVHEVGAFSLILSGGPQVLGDVTTLPGKPGNHW